MPEVDFMELPLRLRNLAQLHAQVKQSIRFIHGWYPSPGLTLLVEKRPNFQK